MEKISSIDRVVGDLSENDKRNVLQEAGEAFNDQTFEDLKNKERLKTSEELQIIALANRATNEIRRRYGLADFNIPQGNFHVIPENKWPENKKADGGIYDPMLQAVAIREQWSNIGFMKSVFHEMLHFKSYNALQAVDKDDLEIKTYRTGLTIETRDGAKRRFTNLNEAVTEEIAKRFIGRLSNSPLFKKEIKQTQEVIAKYPRAVMDSGEPLFTEDTYYAKLERRTGDNGLLRRILGGQKEPSAIDTSHFTYGGERKILNTLLDKLVKRNPEQFQNREEVFEVFAKGMMTGNILPLGRLVEKTFGNGTLRKIGELDWDVAEQEKFVNSL